MRISRDKLNKIAHTVADTLAEIDEVDFLEDRNTIRQEARKALEALLLAETKIDAAGHGLRRMDAFVGEEVPSVLFENEDPDAWKDFVEHAKSASVPFITMSEVLLEPEDIATLIDRIRDQDFPGDSGALDTAQDLLRYSGKTGYLQLGFSSGGVMYLYEAATEWYDQFQELMDAVTDLNGIMVDDPDDDTD